MTGDMVCYERGCGKMIPRSAEYGHMITEHGWDHAKYAANRATRPGEEPTSKAKPWQIKTFEGYDPIIIEGHSIGFKRFGIIGLILTLGVLYFSTKIAIGIIAIQMFLLFVGLREQTDTNNCLNGMIEQVRGRLPDFDQRFSDRSDDEEK